MVYNFGEVTMKKHSFVFVWCANTALNHLYLFLLHHDLYGSDIFIALNLSVSQLYNQYFQLLTKR